MRTITPLIALLLLTVLAASVLIYSGAFNVAANVPHSSLTYWLFNTTMEQSVKRHAEYVAEPPGQQAGDRQAGFLAYRDLCVGCHGAPGVERYAMGKGLTPKPPDLHDEAKEWSTKELFWIIKNGIKMTGMPAWGKTHSDKELWQITFFVEKLPSITPKDYRALEQAAAKTPSGHNHSH